MTFDPLSSVTVPPSHSTAESLALVACPSITQCTALDSEGHELTFNPSTPRSPTLVALNTPPFPWGIACPSRTQCTSLDAGGAITFNPTSRTLDTITIADGSAQAVAHDLACPSVAQCTEVTSNGEAVTFNPSSQHASVPIVIDTIPQTRNPEGKSDVPPKPRTPLIWVACPTRTECTALDEDSNAFAFNPISPRSPIIVTLRPPGLRPGEYVDIACPSPSQCTVIDEFSGYTFDPAAPGSLTPFNWSPHEVGWMTSIACPSTTQCTAATSTGHASGPGGGAAVTFNPNPLPPTVQSWTRAQCKRTFSRWVSKHRRAGRRRRQTEANALRHGHNCPL